MSVPALADSSVGTSVTIGSSGSTPVVKCKWEQEPDNNIYDEAGVNQNLNNVNFLESGDTIHAVYPDRTKTQINPPLIQNTKKLVQYYAVVQNLSNGTIGNVFALVFHPTASPAPYNNFTGNVPSPGARGNSESAANLFKYKVSYSLIGTAQIGGALYNASVLSTFQNAYNANLIDFYGDFDYADALDELQQGLATLWGGTAYIDFEQPAGLYTVDLYAQSNAGALSTVCTNWFRYMALCGIEVDFNAVQFGNVGLNQEVSKGGDQVWDYPLAAAPSPNKATVRNVGNTWTHVLVSETDMAFGITGPGTAGTQYRSIGNGVTGPTAPGVDHTSTTWNVIYDAQMGFSALYKAYFTPNSGTSNPALNTPVVLPNYLGLSMQDKLDFSILVIEGSGTHTGTVTLGCQIEAFSAQGTPTGVPSH